MLAHMLYRGYSDAEFDKIRKNSSDFDITTAEHVKFAQASY